MQPNPAYDYYFLDVVDEQGQFIQSAAQVFVFDAGGTTLATIYSDGAGTAKTNPIVAATFATDKGVSFWGTKDGSYDILVVHNDGRAARLNAIKATTGPKQLVLANSPFRHRIFAFTNTNTVETDTGLDLSKDEIVTDVQVEVVTNAASATVDVGILSSEAGGDANGFVSLASAAAVGFVRPGVTHANGANIDYVSANTRGALLANALVGADAVATPGYYAEKTHRGDGTAKSISYSTSNHSVAGYVHVFSMLAKG